MNATNNIDTYNGLVYGLAIEYFNPIGGYSNFSSYETDFFLKALRTGLKTALYLIFLLMTGDKTIKIHIDRYCDKTAL
jgi:hypothetical protein